MKALKTVAAAVPLLAAFLPAISVAQTSSDWKYEASLYMFLSDIGGRVTVPATGASSDVSVGIDEILDAMQMGFMGSFEARRGRWGVFPDVAYMDVGNDQENSRALSIGRHEIPADINVGLSFDLKLWAVTLVGTYALVADPDFKLDAIAGTRMLDVRPQVDYSLTGNVGPIALPDRSGRREVKEQNWDVLVGLKGRASFRFDGVVRAVLRRPRHRQIEADVPVVGRRRLHVRLGRRGRVVALPGLSVQGRQADRGTELQWPAARVPCSVGDRRWAPMLRT
jgi:hypothetical protein